MYAFIYYVLLYTCGGLRTGCTIWWSPITKVLGTDLRLHSKFLNLLLPPSCKTSNKNGSASPRLTYGNRSCPNIVQEWSLVRRILSAWEKTPRKKKSLVTSVSSNWELFLECIFAFLRGLADRTEFTSDYSS